MSLIKILRSVVSEEDMVLTSEQAKERYGRGTEGIDRNIAAAVVIRAVSSIKALIIKANEISGTESEFTLYPISTGRNWGMGPPFPKKMKTQP